MIRRSSHQYAKISVLALQRCPAFASRTFQKTGSMNVARFSNTATVLANGQVLAGGETVDRQTGQPMIIATAELYKP